MERIVEKGLLFDFYGELLTEHQKNIYEDAVLNDMSLTELSEEYQISRQAAHDIIKRCDKILNEYESKLCLVQRFLKLKKTSDMINENIDDALKSSSVDEIHAHLLTLKRLNEEIRDEIE